MDKYSVLLENIIEFGNRADRISAIIMIGSRVQANNRADEYSDLDLILIVNDIQSFINSNDWLAQIGTHRISFVEQTIDDAWEKRVMFDGALDIDFVIFTQKDAIKAITDGEAREVLREGYSVLVDKSGIAPYLPEIRTAKEPFIYPTEPEYQNVVNDFFYHTIWFGKKLLRGELWAAKFCLDSYMKSKVLWMAELYEHTKHVADYNIPERGRYFDIWASDNVKNKLKAAFAHYDRSDMIRALQVSAKLFRELSTTVAAELNYVYPDSADSYVSEWFYQHIPPQGAHHEHTNIREIQML